MRCRLLPSSNTKGTQLEKYRRSAMRRKEWRNQRGSGSCSGEVEAEVKVEEEDAK